MMRIILCLAVFLGGMSQSGADDAVSSSILGLSSEAEVDVWLERQILSSRHIGVQKAACAVELRARRPPIHCYGIETVMNVSRVELDRLCLEAARGISGRQNPILTESSASISAQCTAALRERVADLEYAGQP